MSWSRRFDDPILVDGGRELKTLGEAGHYIGFLPKETQRRPEWQTAKMLLWAADRGAPVTFAYIAVMQAISSTKPEPEPRRKRAKKYRVVQ